MWKKFTQLTVSWRWHILWPREAVVWQELLVCSFPKLHPVLSPASFSTAVSPASASPLWLISGVWIPLWLCCHERDFSYLVLKSNPWPEKAKGEKNSNMKWDGYSGKQNTSFLIKNRSLQTGNCIPRLWKQEQLHTENEEQSFKTVL